MELLNDIKEFLKDDDDHNVKIEVSWDGVTVYLEYDPGLDFNEDCIIPIHYCTIEEFAYIPHDQYCKMYHPCDYGMDLNEIKIISEIMQYFKDHKRYIKELCDGCCLEDRQAHKDKHSE